MGRGRSLVGRLIFTAEPATQTSSVDSSVDFLTSIETQPFWAIFRCWEGGEEEKEKKEEGEGREGKEGKERGKRRREERDL